MASQKNDAYNEKRLYKRVPVPSGTTASFTSDGQVKDTLSVMNISAGGMLLCDGSSKIKYHLDTAIYDISTKIHLSEGKGMSTTGNSTSFLIGHGMVVRSYLEKKSNRAFYGISFIYSNPSIKVSITNLVHTILE